MSQIQQEAANLEKSKMHRDISELEENIQGVSAFLGSHILLLLTSDIHFKQLLSLAVFSLDLLKSHAVMPFYNSNIFGYLFFKLQLELERCELKTTVSILKERINSLENELKLKSSKLAQTSDDSSQFKAEICSLQ